MSTRSQILPRCRLGIGDTKLTYKFQGREFRLTDVHGKVVRKLLI